MAARRLTAISNQAPQRRSASRRANSVAKAAADGDARGQLVGMRARVAAAIDDPNTPTRDLAALTRRLMEINKDIEALDARNEDEGDGASADDESFDASSL